MARRQNAMTTLRRRFTGSRSAGSKEIKEVQGFIEYFTDAECQPAFRLAKRLQSAIASLVRYLLSVQNLRVGFPGQFVGKHQPTTEGSLPRTPEPLNPLNP
jgi:hypothetical protein